MDNQNLSIINKVLNITDIEDADLVLQDTI